MNKKQLYDTITARKIKPKDFEPYDGNNGRVNKCADLIRRGELKSGGTLVDVGGGIGDLGYAVRDLFDKRVVVDISEQNLEAARAKGNYIAKRDVDTEGLGLSTFVSEDCVDLITALDFIEHIIDPEYFARECYRLLSSSGQVFINTPNIRFWKHIEQLWLGGVFPHTSGDKEVFHGGHLAFFTYGDLCNIFGNAGFKDFKMIKDEEGYSQPPPQILNPMTEKSMTQQGYVQNCLEFGCPNLLFKCEKP